MEQQNELTTNMELIVRPEDYIIQSTERTFITANTVPVTLNELKNDHLIPVFVKDNEKCISQYEFVEAMMDVTQQTFNLENILDPLIRVSHPIKGRTPEARAKKADQLEDWEKTLYYERMAFAIEMPSISDVINGNRVCLSVVGIKSHASDNLYNKKGTDEHFKIAIGFQNKVCTNLCLWTDGYLSDLKVNSIGQLKACMSTLLESYNANFHLFHLKRLADYSLTEQQFALLIGRCRMYSNLPPKIKSTIPVMLFGDSQINSVCRDYYKSDSFCKDEHGNINLWKLYNLFTSANKTTYIDNILDKSVNAFQFIEQIRSAVEHKNTNWFLN